MRRISVVLTVTALSLTLGVGSAAWAQAPTTLPGVPTGQGGPDNDVNDTQQGGSAPGGRDNPVADAGPVAATENDGSSIAPWLIGAAVLLLVIAGAAFLVRRATADRGEPSFS